MRKLANTPIWLRLTGAIWLMLIIAWGGMIAWETRVNRETAIDQAQDFANSIHEMTMAGLIGMMITGTVSQLAQAGEPFFGNGGFLARLGFKADEQSELELILGHDSPPASWLSS